jgi:hypothetical protein
VKDTQKKNPMPMEGRRGEKGLVKKNIHLDLTVFWLE